MAFETHYYSTAAGNTPVKEFVDSLNFKIQQKFYAREEKLLSAYGENLPPPHVHNLGDGIYEFIVSFGRLEYRFLFFRVSNHLIFVHAFQKKTQQVPNQEIDLAKKRRQDFFEQLKKGRIEP